MSVGMMYMPNFTRNLERGMGDDSDAEASPEIFKLRKTKSNRRPRPKFDGKENGNEYDFEDENPMLASKKEKYSGGRPDPTSRNSAPVFRPRDMSKSSNSFNLRRNMDTEVEEFSSESKAPETRRKSSDSRGSFSRQPMFEDRDEKPRLHDWASAGRYSHRHNSQKRTHFDVEEFDEDDVQNEDSHTGRRSPPLWNAARRSSKTGNNVSSSDGSPRHYRDKGNMTDTSGSDSDMDTRRRRKHDSNKEEREGRLPRSETPVGDDEKKSASPDCSPMSEKSDRSHRMAKARPIGGTVTESLRNVLTVAGGDDSILGESTGTLWSGSPRKSARSTARDKYAGSKNYPGESVIPNIMTSYTRGPVTTHIQCFIRRDRASSLSNKLLPTYEMYLEGSHSPLLYATKQGYNVTSNYHIFDLTRGMPGGVKALSKKSGNYVGKLRSKTLQGNEYVLVNNAPDKGELAAFVYEQLDIMAQVREGPLPRRVVVTVPPIGDDGEPIPQEAKGPKGTLIPMCIPKTRDERARDMCIFQTKDPSYENGCYRLNFNGRVKVPSVKNFQLVSAADPEDVVFQFGKFDDEKFTVDFKAPFTAFQAFALALSQFDF